MIKLKENSLFAFSGDSITDGNRVQRMDCNHIFGHGYQTIVAGKMCADNLDTRPKMLNMGHTGWTVEMIYSRWQEEILAFSPTHISILIGINDVAGGWTNQTEPNVVAENYAKTYAALLETTKKALPETKLILCEPFFKAAMNHHDPYRNVPHPIHGEDFKLLDFGTSAEQIEYFENELGQMRDSLRDLAKEYGCIHVPLQDVFDEAAKSAPVEYLLWDSVHPTITGHELIARRWLECVEKGL